MNETKTPRIAIVSSQWHERIVHACVSAFTQELEAEGVASVEHHVVAGAFEIPLKVQRLARGGAHDAIVACAFVVDGGIYRHEFVAQVVLDALMRIQLEEDLPVHSAVLTPHAFHEHDDHVAFFTSHFARKGLELAQAVRQTLSTQSDTTLGSTAVC